MNLFVLHANDWNGYLACHLFKDAKILPWRIDWIADDIVDRLASGVAHDSRESALLFHIDLSDTRSIPRDRPELMRRLVSRRITHLNSRCDDLSRRRLQQRLRELDLNSVAIDSSVGAETPVIVKSDPNHGGKPELRLSPQQRDALGIRFSGRWFRRPRDYRVLLLSAVPPEVLDSPDYVVERYVENDAGRFYRVYVSGVAVVVVRAYSPGPIRVIRGDGRDDNLAFEIDELARYSGDEIPAELARAIVTFVRAEEVHFGSFDVVQDNAGDVFVVDFNTTPWGGATAPDGDIIDFLREGFLEGAARAGARQRHRENAGNE